MADVGSTIYPGYCPIYGAQLLHLATVNDEVGRPFFLQIDHIQSANPDLGLAHNYWYSVGN